jgi:hypothetical protein
VFCLVRRYRSTGNCSRPDRRACQQLEQVGLLGLSATSESESVALEVSGKWYHQQQMCGEQQLGPEERLRVSQRYVDMIFRRDV